MSPTQALWKCVRYINVEEYRPSTGPLTFDQQVAGSADGSCLVGGGAAETAAVFGERLADHQARDPVRVAGVEVDGTFNLVILSEPHDDRGRLAADLTFQSQRLALGHRHVLQSLRGNKNIPVPPVEPESKLAGSH